MAVRRTIRPQGRAASGSRPTPKQRRLIRKVRRNSPVNQAKRRAKATTRRATAKPTSRKTTVGGPVKKTNKMQPPRPLK